MFGKNKLFAAVTRNNTAVVTTGFGTSYSLRETAKSYAASAAFAHVLDGAKALDKQNLALSKAAEKLADLRQQVLAAEAEHEFEESETLRLADTLGLDARQAMDIVADCFVNDLKKASQETRALTEAENLRFRKMKDTLAQISSFAYQLAKKLSASVSSEIPKDTIVPQSGGSKPSAYKDWANV